MCKPDEMCNVVGNNPTHQHKDGTWWWYDETWAHEYGPFTSEEEANKALKEYCKTL